MSALFDDEQTITLGYKALLLVADRFSLLFLYLGLVYGQSPSCFFKGVHTSQEHSIPSITSIVEG